MQQIADALKLYLHEHLFALSPWVDQAMGHLVDFALGPLTGTNTRFYWVYLAEAAGLLLVLHLARARTIRGFYQFCFPRAVMTHRSTWIDWQLNLANQVFGQSFKIFWRLSVPGLTALFLAWIELGFGPAQHYWTYGWGSLTVLTILVLLGDDLGYYAFHRAAHNIPALWAFHKVHHSAEVLTPLVAGRVHPIEMALSEPVRAAGAAMVLAPALWLFDGEPAFLTVFGISVTSLIFGALGNQLLHTETPISWGPKLDRILVSPSVHHLHHSTAPQHFNKNMGGLLAIWDWMFGTLVLPVPGETVRFGLDDSGRQVHPNFLAAYALPFWDMLPERLRDAMTGTATAGAGGGMMAASGMTHSGMTLSGMTTGMATGVIDAGLIDAGRIDTGRIDAGLIEPRLVEPRLVDSGMTAGAMDKLSAP